MRRLLWISTIVCLVALACFQVPLGDSARSRVDHRLDGVWLSASDSGDEYEAYFVVPFDERVDCLMLAKFEIENGELKQRVLHVARAWTTEIGAATFVSFERIAQMLPKFDGLRSFVNARLEFAPDGTLVARSLAYAKAGLRGVKSAEELTRLIAGRLDDPALFEEPVKFHRPDPANAIERKIRDHFLNN
jgi:hypothetical protein